MRQVAQNEVSASKEPNFYPLLTHKQHTQTLAVLQHRKCHQQPGPASRLEMAEGREIGHIAQRHGGQAAQFHSPVVKKRDTTGSIVDRVNAGFLPARG